MIQAKGIILSQDFLNARLSTNDFDPFIMNPSPDIPRTNINYFPIMLEYSSLSSKTILGEEQFILTYEISKY